MWYVESLGIGSRLFFFVGSDFGLYCFPVDFNFLGELLKFVVCFLFVVHVKESLAVSNDSVHVGLVLHGNVEGVLPAIHLDVEFDGAVV